MQLGQKYGRLLLQRGPRISTFFFLFNRIGNHMCWKCTCSTSPRPGSEHQMLCTGHLWFQNEEYGSAGREALRISTESPRSPHWPRAAEDLAQKIQWIRQWGLRCQNKPICLTRGISLVCWEILKFLVKILHVWPWASLFPSLDNSLLIPGINVIVVKEGRIVDWCKMLSTVFNIQQSLKTSSHHGTKTHSTWEWGPL